jgi:hypothetical protein
LKPSKCKVCGTEYVKKAQFQKWCGFECAAVLAEQALAKKKAKEAAQDRRQTREKLKAMEKYPVLVKRAQMAVNSYVRVRDAGGSCISCQKPLGTEPNTYDAGHYRSVGSAPHMRFVEDQINGQCKHCNQYLSGNPIGYRKGLIERIGLDRVEQIESDQTIRKYTREGLSELAKQYREMTRQLIKDRE